MSEYVKRFLPILPPVILAVVVLVILWGARRSLSEFAGFIKTAWADEWRGRDRVGKCNRGGTIVWFILAFGVFITREFHSLLRSQHEGMGSVVWLFLSGMAFLMVSLLTLANLERYRMFLDNRRRRAPAQTPRRRA